MADELQNEPLEKLIREWIRQELQKRDVVLLIARVIREELEAHARRTGR